MKDAANDTLLDSSLVESWQRSVSRHDAEDMVNWSSTRQLFTHQNSEIRSVPSFGLERNGMMEKWKLYF